MSLREPHASGVAALAAVSLLMVLAFARSQQGRDASPDAGAVVHPLPPPPQSPSCPSDMALIPAGEFLMGSPDGQGNTDEHPQHRVRFAQPFCIDRTEVSVSAYRACVNDGGHCTAPNPFRDARHDNDYFCNWDRPGADDHPVNCVDWMQAKAFCEWSGHTDGARRLPREAEWEYAVRGSANRIYPWGNDGLDGTRANLCGDECVQYARDHGFRNWTQLAGWHDEYGATAPVTAFSMTGATPEGVLNLAGNVWEWVDDVYASDAYLHHDSAGFYARDASTPSQTTELRVYRGGGWYNIDASRARAAVRDWVEPTVRYSALGVRCARGVR